MLRLYNTLTRKKEAFKPVHKGSVGMYICGPTVHDTAHIGNMRTNIFGDLLRRTFEYLGHDVKQVMNITDIEDKIIIKAKRSKRKRMADITKKYTKEFLSDIKKLNIKSADEYPRATTHTKDMVRLIAELMDKGFAYKAKDKSVYFDISKFKEYGKLVGLENIKIKDGARVSDDEYKDEARDFVLWKAKKKGEPSWPSPWGRGRPGWHIECSVMSMKYLGETFDVHVGGIDLVFPHHENEIAQSEATTSKKFVNHWLHGEHLLVDGKKMAKSAGNFFTLRDVEKKRYMPLALRYLALSAHYKSKLNFTWRSLEGADSALWNLWRELGRLKFLSEKDTFKTSKKAIAGHKENFKAALEDDLDIPGAMAVMRRAVGDPDISPTDKRALAFDMDKVFGLKLKRADKLYKTPIHIKTLVRGRELLRRNQQFVKADTLRRRIESLGYEVEDTSYGPFIWPIRNQKFRRKI